MIYLSNLLNRVLFVLLKLRLFFFKLEFKRQKRQHVKLSNQRVAILVDNEPVDSLSFLSLAKIVQKILIKNGVESKILFVDKKLFQNLKKHNISLVFIGFSRIYRKEGTIQALLDYLDIKYVGSSHLSVALCFDKSLCKKISIAQGVKAPKFLEIRHLKEVNISKVKQELKFPVIVKGNHSYISMGLSYVNDSKSLFLAVEECLSFDDSVLIEEYIDGQEVSIGVIGTLDNPKPLGIVCLKKNTVVSFKDKKMASIEIDYDMKLSEETKLRIINTALTLFKSFGCRGFARFDFIIKKGEVYFLEVNGIPGLFKESLMTKSAEIAGMSHEDLIMNILVSALGKSDYLSFK
ncbi:MAG: ATP-grasp domain-containing protein [Nanoarchaeota archaeon]|nr:ATP-grasp domain-containing protein [Nanoarchaeota archaeon]MBU1269453.1 ATP-grasp domain-containing protein [Nanoarchaeota archaeon]MBU1604610.1 ATP-grasp domain-containing protein [Nanoarchaeota archaeon]MBU2442760.1 ATP-grasp domain-containing protein [Nanoarchaeota archaeon]